MPKRSAEEKMERYRKKLRKLEGKVRRHTRIRVIDSSESDAENNSGAEEIKAKSPEPPLDVTENAIEAQGTELDPDILLALGETTDETPKFGAPIHENLAQRWGPILKKGIPKEAKETLLKQYPILENCTLLQAPKINVEISAAITDYAKNRDKKMESSQQQLGFGITAINRALSLLVTGDDKVQAIQLLSDGCRILADVHYTETQARTKLLTPGLDKSFLGIIRDTERDETLFGSNISEKIKASKVIEKQGLQIKKTTTTQKTSTPAPQSTPARPRYQENWAGPSRYPSNRGGRGGTRKPTFSNRRPPPTHQTKPSNQNKPRAPVQH